MLSYLKERISTTRSLKFFIVLPLTPPPPNPTNQQVQVTEVGRGGWGGMQLHPPEEAQLFFFSLQEAKIRQDLWPVRPPHPPPQHTGSSDTYGTFHTWRQMRESKSKSTTDRQRTIRGNEYCQSGTVKACQLVHC